MSIWTSHERVTLTKRKNIWIMIKPSIASCFLYFWMLRERDKYSSKLEFSSSIALWAYAPSCAVWMVIVKYDEVVVEKTAQIAFTWNQSKIQFVFWKLLFHLKHAFELFKYSVYKYDQRNMTTMAKLQANCNRLQHVPMEQGACKGLAGTVGVSPWLAQTVPNATSPPARTTSSRLLHFTH